MSTIIIWIFIAYGMTSILNWGSIFETPRKWIINRSTFFGELIQCPICTGTWVGMVLSIITGGLCNQYLNIINYDLPIWVDRSISILLDGTFTAGAVWALNSIIEFFEESRIK
jgi:hypothetical protein